MLAGLASIRTRYHHNKTRSSNPVSPRTNRDELSAPPPPPPLPAALIQIEVLLHYASRSAVEPNPPSPRNISELSPPVRPVHHKEWKNKLFSYNYGNIKPTAVGKKTSCYGMNNSSEFVINALPSNSEMCHPRCAFKLYGEVNSVKKNKENKEKDKKMSD